MTKRKSEAPKEDCSTQEMGSAPKEDSLPSFMWPAPCAKSRLPTNRAPKAGAHFFRASSFLRISLQLGLEQRGGPRNRADQNSKSADIPRRGPRRGCPRMYVGLWSNKQYLMTPLFIFDYWIWVRIKCKKFIKRSSTNKSKNLFTLKTLAEIQKILSETV